MPANQDSEYVRLFLLNELDRSLAGILSFNGAASLTVCPECLVDDFTHVEGCSLLAKCETLAYYKANGYIATQRKFHLTLYEIKDLKDFAHVE